jgi:hypothetical protein
MSKFSWETYRPTQPQQPLEPEGFFRGLAGYMKALFDLATNYVRHG